MNLFTWGANTYGQLSHGVLSELCVSPTAAVVSQALGEVVALAAGGRHTLVLQSDGAVMGVGCNSDGQLGTCKNNSSTLKLMETLQEFKLCQIECGWDSSYAITDTGSVVVWGSNRYGQLGVSKEKVVTTQHPVALDMSHVVQVSSGLRHTALVSGDGHVYVCGRGNKGQLGVLADGKVPTQDIDYLTKVDGLENVKQVCCGQNHTLALTQEGCLYGWGDNRRGQLGEGEETWPTPRLIFSPGPAASVRAGWTHSAVLVDGSVMTWGRNSYGQLGHSWGQEQVNKPHQLTDMPAVRQLELGSEHNLVLLENGEVWSWGWNEHGSCGNGSVKDVLSPQPVQVPYPSTMVAAGGGHSLTLMVL